MWLEKRIMVKWGVYKLCYFKKKSVCFIYTQKYHYSIYKTKNNETERFQKPPLQLHNANEFANHMVSLS